MDESVTETSIDSPLIKEDNVELQEDQKETSSENVGFEEKQDDKSDVLNTLNVLSDNEEKEENVDKIESVEIVEEPLQKSLTIEPLSPSAVYPIRDVNAEIPSAFRILLLSKNSSSLHTQNGHILEELRRKHSLLVSLTEDNTNQQILSMLTLDKNINSYLDALLEILPHLGKAPYESVEQREFEIDLMVHHRVAGGVIGHSGSMIKLLKETTKSALKVFAECLPGSSERIIAISGSPYEIRLTCLKILEISDRISERAFVGPLYDPTKESPDYGTKKSNPRSARKNMNSMGVGVNHHLNYAPYNPNMYHSMDSSQPHHMDRHRMFNMSNSYQMQFSMHGYSASGSSYPSFPGGAHQNMRQSALPPDHPHLENVHNSAVSTKVYSHPMMPSATPAVSSYDPSSPIYPLMPTNSAYHSYPMPPHLYNTNNMYSPAQNLPQFANVMNDNGPKTTSQVTIPSSLAGPIIGHKGARITEVRMRSGCDINIGDQMEGSTERVITIKGTELQVQYAQLLMQECVRNYSTNKT